jgi:hypothetical protein
MLHKEQSYVRQRDGFYGGFPTRRGAGKGKRIGGRAVDVGIPLLTNIQLANRLAESLSRQQAVNLGIKQLQAY